MKVRTKLIIGFAVIVLMAWATINFAIKNSSDIYEDFVELEEVKVPRIVLVSEMEKPANDASGGITNYILYGNERDKRETLAATKHLEEIGQAYLEHQRRTGHEEQTAWELAMKIEMFNNAITELITWKDQKVGFDEILNRNSEYFQPISVALIEEIRENQATRNKEISEARESLYRAHISARQLLVIAAGLITLLAVTAAILTTRSIVKPLSALHKGTEMVEQGNLDYKVGTRAKDEIGQLSRAFDHMTQSLSTSMTSIHNLNREITERRRAEEALRESEQFSTSLLENAPNPVEVVNPDTSVKYVNPAFENLTGFTSDEAAGQKAPYPWWPEETREEIRDKLLEDIASEGRRMELVMKKKNGERLWVMVSAASVKLNGRAEYFLINWVDITARKRAEEEMRLFSNAVAGAIDAIAITDIAGIITYTNSAMEEIYGYEKGEMLGKSVVSLNENPEMANEIMSTMIKTGSWNGEIESIKKNKETFLAFLSLSTVRDEKGNPIAMMGALRDITERKQAEEKLKQVLTNLEHSNAQLAATNKELEAFSYSVSHDLRAPLRSIDGFSQALLEDYLDELDEQGRDYLARLRLASQKMGELIDGLLKLSRLTRSEMRREKVDLSALALEIANNLQETQPKRHVKFVIKTKLTDIGDRQLLRAVLENLLGNAWKFTSRRRRPMIEFGVTQNGDKQAYFVKDTGAGFDMNYADKLFGAFQRLHTADEFPGTGIGLATVQRIIHRHGGSIWAEGAVDKGATFYFTLN